MRTQPVQLKISDLFCTSDRVLFPSEIEMEGLIRDVDSEIDVIIASHDLPEMTNLTIENYLSLEENSRIHIIVVESSGSRRVFEALRDHERVSKVLLKKDVRITDRFHGYGSYGMALSAAIGTKLSRAPYVFYSHSDMIALRAGFLSFLKSKLANGVRLAAFTQRHVIPFSGCMMVHRSLIEEPGIDWLPMDRNEGLEKSALKDLGSLIRTLNHVDCGEQFVYHEIFAGRPVHVCASRGGSKDWWGDPLDYEETPVEKLWALARNSGASIRYAELRIGKEQFRSRYSQVINAGREKWHFFEKPKWWRYGFDDEGNLSFIHHGRGATGKAVRRWVAFGRSLQDARNA